MENEVELAEAISELRLLSVKALALRYEGLFGKPPRVKHRDWLWKRCAWRLQEERYGGLSESAKRRLEELIAEIKLPLDGSEWSVVGRLSKPRKCDGPPAGTVLFRDWHGKRFEVRVLENGLEYEAKVYRSLSAIAKAITGAHWNGKLFFGLTGRRKR